MYEVQIIEYLEAHARSNMREISQGVHLPEGKVLQCLRRLLRKGVIGPVNAIELKASRFVLHRTP